VDLFKDDFNDNSINTTKWLAGGSPYTISEQSSQLWLTTTTASGESWLEAKTNYSMVGSYMMCEIIDAGNQSLASLDVFPILFEIPAVTFVSFHIKAGIIYARHSSLNKASDTYSNSKHRWLRIREASGTTYWEYSANGTVWTTLYSEATGFTITSVKAYILDVLAGAEGSTTIAKIDNFNIVPAVTAWFTA
jgi:hypothetical protein